MTENQRNKPFDLEDSANAIEGIVSVFWGFIRRINSISNLSFLVESVLHCDLL